MAGIPRATLAATCPGGKAIKLRELRGADEIAAAREAGESQVLYLHGQILRSLVEVGGAPFDASSHTPESVRDLFTAKEWQFVLEAFATLHRPTTKEAEEFRATFRHSAEGGD